MQVRVEEGEMKNAEARAPRRLGVPAGGVPRGFGTQADYRVKRCDCRLIGRRDGRRGQPA